MSNETEVALSDGIALNNGSVVDASEARRVLLGEARRGTGRIPEEYVVDHLLAANDGNPFPVVREALAATLRRQKSMEDGRFSIALRPKAGASFGAFCVSRRSEAAGPVYHVWVESLRPLRASCECADFVRNSLGLCKHVLCVLDDLARGRRRFAAALEAPPSLGAVELPCVVWNPCRPLAGTGAWWERLALRRAGDRQALFLRAFFRGAGPDPRPIDGNAVRRPEQRAALVRSLVQALGQQRLAAEPAVHALLAAEDERLSARAPAAGLAIDRHLKTLKRKLYPYQKEGVLKAIEAGRLLLADDMGLGKTAQAIAVAHVLHAEGLVRRGLIVAPASLKSQWSREWALFTDTPIAVIEGSPETRAATYQGCKDGFLIANYEQIIRDVRIIGEWNPELVILDEAQRIKNWETVTAAAIKRLRPPRRLVLTGTPIENRLGELASIMDWVDDFALEPKWRLGAAHEVRSDGKRDIIGARNLETIRARVEPSLLRRLRSDVLGQLPSRTDTVVPVALSPRQRDEHDALNQPIVALVQRAKSRPLLPAEFLRLMQLLTRQRMIANAMALCEFTDVWPTLHPQPPSAAVIETIAAPKLTEFREIVANVAVNQGRRIVVFSQWRRMLDLAHWSVGQVLRGAGYRGAFFSGQESQRQRTRNVVDFHDDAVTRILFATDAGGVGLNLQRAASCCVNLDLPWNPAVLEQRIGRIHRLGQTRPIDVYNLVAEDSIESRIARVVADKRALFKGLFDGASDEVRFERSGSFMATLQRIAAPAPAAGPGADADDADLDALDPAVEDALQEAPDPEAPADDPDASPALPRDGAPRVAAPLREEAGSDADPVGDLFARVHVRKTPGGGLTIEAPPDAATALAALFEGFGRLLRGA